LRAFHGSKRFRQSIEEAFPILDTPDAVALNLSPFISLLGFSS